MELWDTVGLSIESARLQCTRIYVRPEPLPELPAKSADVARIYATGIDQVIAEMERYQPRAANALARSFGKLIVAESKWKDPWGEHANYRFLIEISGRLIHFDYFERLKHVALHWMPASIAKAYYCDNLGWDVLKELPSNVFDQRMLPTIEFNHVREVMKTMNIGDHQADVIADQLKLPPRGISAAAVPKDEFYVLIDCRPHGRNTPQGDLLLIKKSNPDQSIFHIMDGDFENPRVLTDPVTAIDHYVEHVFLWRKERFDFTAHSQPIT
jgi:hypothetical protein